jgi:hypothetical protein
MLVKNASSLLALCFLFVCCGLSAEKASEQEKPKEKEAKPGAASTAQNPSQSAPLPRAAVDPNKFALIIAGVGGEEAYSKKFASAATKLYNALTMRLGFPEQNVALLTETGTGGVEDGVVDPDLTVAPIWTGRSTIEEVRKAFARVKAGSKVDSLVLVVMIGHGSFDNQQAKFNLVGPDLEAKDYAALLGSLPSKKVVFVNCSSASGEFVKPLSAEGRIIITATRSGNEQNATIFADNFVAALTDQAADSDKNGRLSVLEAFSYATRLTQDWYKQKDRLATEHALIDDNGDGVGHEEATGGDGSIAKTTYLDSKTVEQAAGDAATIQLLETRQKLEESIERLKARKAQMKPEEYETELERLLLDLARVNRSIRERKK